MESGRDFWESFSRHFVLRQQEADNLTSYDAYPLPGTLVEVSYPVDFEGNLVAPEQLLVHSRSHMFPFPACFHGCNSKVVVTNNDLQVNGRNTVHLLCGSNLSGARCGFHVNVTKILSNSRGAVKFAHYRFRQGSADSSLGLPTPVSMSSIDSFSENSRMSTDEEFLITPSTTDQLQVNSNSPSVCSSDDMDSFIDDSSLEDDDGYLTDVSDEGSMSVGDSDVTSSGGDESCMSELVLDDAVFGHGNGSSSDQAGQGVTSLRGANVSSVIPRGSRIIVHASRVTIRKSPKKAKAVYDGDAYPLLARQDGLPAIASCIDPTSREFSDELFLSQIVSDSFTRKVGY